MKKAIKLLALPILVITLLVGGAWTAQDETDTRYADAPLLATYASETINYATKEIVDNKTTDGGVPQFTQMSGLTNACGAVAGTEIVAFYDKYYPELIPGWVSYYTANGKYRPADKTYVPAVMNELYTLMRTNVDDVGVSETDFKNGLKSYVNGKGYSLNYQSVVSSGKLNYSTCKSAIDSNRVIALFVSAGDVYSITTGASTDTITPTNISGNHIMVAYGYQQIKYYNAAGTVFRTDTYLMVVTGRTAPQMALYKINATNLLSAYIINIS